MDNSKELRKILSKNIKTIRSKLHISQAKLAEFADISLSYLADIERCRTWVSDKTLQNLANALNIEAWELIFPNNENNGAEQDFISNQKNKIQRIADLISKKREILHRTTDKAMEDLIMEIVKEGS
ncbi:MAG: helix-turn-helix domain-containing protein [Treponema sp.]|nr:helix-turn-helix domain-containing protein [Treponema sp.]